MQRGRLDNGRNHCPPLEPPLHISPQCRAFLAVSLRLLLLEQRIDSLTSEVLIDSTRDLWGGQFSVGLHEES
jgi:hypothetical protein